MARQPGVDLARGVAIFGMFVAHTAPSAGPVGVLALSEYFPFPLFAMLMGAGAELVSRRMAPTRHAAESVVRAVLLVLIGWAITQAGAQVAIVLGALGVVALVGWLLALAPSAVLLVTALLGFAASGWWVERVEQWRWDQLLAGETAIVRGADLVVSSYYPLPYVVACAAWGIVVLRVLLPRTGERPGVVVPAVGAVVLTAAAAAVVVAGRAGHLDVTASSWGWPTLAVNGLLATAAVLGCDALARVRPSVVVKVVVKIGAAVGAMAFTLYTLHVLWLALWVRVLYPGERDDAWANVVGMSVVAVLLALGWRSLRLGGRWWRGPVEGVVGSVTGFVGRRVA